MELVLTLPADFPVDHIPVAQDIVQLIKNKDWATLDNIPICVDSYGKVIARFGQSVWDCSSFTADKGSEKWAQQFDFCFLVNNPHLLLQAKLICYGWMYRIGHKSGQQCKLSTLAGRFNKVLKSIMSFLLQHGRDDLCALNYPNIWKLWELHLAESNLSVSSIQEKFITLSAVARLGDWLPFHLSLPDINFKTLAIKLAGEEKKQKNQTLAIPETLVDILYGEAIDLVEKAWPHRKNLAKLERDLQTNYDAGRATIDYKISTKKLTFLIDEFGEIKSHLYAREINKASPSPQSSIIINALSSTGLLPNRDIDGVWFSGWRSQLQTACFICCSAFSGMRVSELFELRQNSFYTHTIDGQIFHAVRAATHKLAAGKKYEEWLCSPVVEKAIELATSLSASPRENMLRLALSTTDHSEAKKLRNMSECLWLSQVNRSLPPTVVYRSNWNTRLKLFAKNVGAVIDDAILTECLLMNPQSHTTIHKKIKVGQSWPLTTHQFRRTFACFAVRHHLGHPMAIKQQFKHLYLRMSEWYSNGAIEARLKDIQMDSDIIKLLDNADIENTTGMYNLWFNGDEPLSGGYGKAVVAMRNSKPVIYSNWENLYRLVKEKRLTLHGTLHSYCKNGYECDMTGVANPALCIECSGSVINAKKAQWWKNTHTRLTIYLREKSKVSLGEYAHCITQIRAAEKVMHDHQINYQTFQYPVEVINL